MKMIDRNITITQSIVAGRVGRELTATDALGLFLFCMHTAAFIAQSLL